MSGALKDHGLEVPGEVKTETLDLRGAGTALAARLLAEVRERLAPGRCLEARFDQDPALALESAALALRHRMHWTLTRAGPAEWRARILHRDDAPLRGITDLLARDHERLDRLFAQALAAANAGDLAGALARLRPFEEGLSRHMEVEDRLLTPRLDGDPDTLAHDDPAVIMLREHREIREQAVLARETAEAGDVAMLATLLGMLSAAMAKHEAREEQNLFPRWERTLRGRDDAAALLEQARTLIGEGVG